MTIFEKIIAREIPASIIYEDEYIISFLDIKPNNKGHALVVPKKVSANALDADEETFAHMARVAQRVARALVAALGATGVNFVMNNGEDAGQEVPHAHLHVIPRFKNDNSFPTFRKLSYADGEADVLAEKIKASIV